MLRLNFIPSRSSNSASRNRPLMMSTANVGTLVLGLLSSVRAAPQIDHIVLLMEENRVCWHTPQLLCVDPPSRLCFSGGLHACTPFQRNPDVNNLCTTPQRTAA